MSWRIKITVLALTFTTLYPVDKAVAQLEQTPPVMNGSGSFLGAPLTDGPGYLPPDPTPFILDSVLPSPRTATLAPHLANAHRWALEISQEYAESNLYSKANELTLANAELRVNIKKEKTSRFINDIFIRGGESMIFLEDILSGNTTESALHAANTANYILDRLKRDLAKEEKYYKYVETLIKKESMEQESIAATDVIARGWYGTLLALDRLAAYSDLSSEDLEHMVNFASTRMQYYLYDQVNQSKSSTLTLPDRKRSVASAEGVTINPSSMQSAENTDYGLMDVMITYRDNELDQVLANFDPEILLTYLKSVKDNLGNKYYYEPQSSNLQPYRVSPNKEKRFISSHLVQASLGVIRPSKSKITLYEITPGGLIKEVSRLVTDINTAPLISDGFLVDEETFNLLALNKITENHVIVDVKVNPIGARTLSALRSLAEENQFTLKENSPAPTPFSYLDEERSNNLLLNMKFSETENGSLSIDQNFLQSQLSMVNIPLLGRIFCSKHASRQFAGAMLTSSILGFSTELNRSEFGGCYNPRYIGDSGVPSYHTRGLAIDINVPSNSLGTFGKLDERLVTLFKAWGLRWGGDWVSIDPMHFELAALLSS
ncbi:MAG: M15 family metallopeptidase [Candidatus Paceibacterota bacterium]